VSQERTVASSLLLKLPLRPLFQLFHKSRIFKLAQENLEKLLELTAILTSNSSQDAKVMPLINLEKTAPLPMLK
jgi:hypothetical protein